MGINDRFRRESNNNITNCPTSVATIELGGKYTFCLHEIKVFKTDLFFNLQNPRFGNGPFCEFCVIDNNHLKEHGLYCFIVNGNLKYIGQVSSRSNFDERINRGYGRITPANLNQQSTNCHVNSLLNDEINNKSEILVGFYEMNDYSDDEIRSLESFLIDKYDLDRYGWNKRR